MIIYDAVATAILKGSPIAQAIDDKMVMEDRIKAMRTALTGQYSKIESIVTEILKEKGKL